MAAYNTLMPILLSFRCFNLKVLVDTGTNRFGSILSLLVYREAPHETLENFRPALILGLLAELLVALGLRLASLFGTLCSSAACNAAK